LCSCATTCAGCLRIRCSGTWSAAAAGVQQLLSSGVWRLWASAGAPRCHGAAGCSRPSDCSSSCRGRTRLRLAVVESSMWLQ
jgi:hypothetical protein